MAPQNKRAAASKVPAAKKAKTTPVPEPEDALTLQLNPILAALEASELPGDCCEIFRAALPHCLAEASAERHSFQLKMLDLASDALKRLEEAGRSALKTAEEKASSLHADSAVAATDFEAAQRLATAKQEESNAKSAEVEKLRGEENAAKEELAEAVKNKETFLVEKVQFVADVEAFQKLLDDMWQPLKSGAFPGAQWRKRDKVLAELMEKLKPLGLDESLVEALLVALKLRLDQRTAFAQKAFDCAEGAFEKHKAALAERVAGTATEEETRDRMVTEAEAKVAEIHLKFTEQDKVYDELQNAWAELETTSNAAKSKAASIETEVQAAAADIAARQADLEAALQVAASFVVLKDPPAPVAQEQPVASTEVQEVPEPAISMEAEPEAVAVAA